MLFTCRGFRFLKFVNFVEFCGFGNSFGLNGVGFCGKLQAMSLYLHNKMFKEDSQRLANSV